MNLLLSSSDWRGIKCLIAAIGLLLSWTAPAAQVKLDLLVVGSRSYTNVTILNYTTTHIYFTHNGGSTSVKLRDLEPKFQKRFEYDPAAAAEAEKLQAAEEEHYRESIVSSMVAQAQQATLAARRAAATSPDSLADPVSSASLIGKPAPAMEGRKWLGEKPAVEGKVVLVVFWAPWSYPCRKYIPALEGLQRKFEGKLAVVGVTSEAEAEIANMSEPKPGFASMLDPEARFSTSVGVTSIPYVMLVDPKGIVRYQGHPATITEKQVEGILAKAAE
jgi:cytochrome c biogenesis protein CcmG, thiol:disulfide interchange protein DsbE